MSFTRIIGLALVLTFSLSACEKKEYQSIEELDNINIAKYIQDKNLNVTRYKNTDLYFQVIDEGTGSPLQFNKKYPIIYTLESHDGKFKSLDTIGVNNRYYDFLGYFPFTSAYAGLPNSPIERQDDIKNVVLDQLKNSNGRIRILSPSRLTPWGRQGSTTLGIPPNASIDYTISVYEDINEYEDQVIQQSIIRSGQQVNQYTKDSLTGIYYRILSPGSGETITSASTVNTTYTLKDTQGRVIESQTDVNLSLQSGTISAFSKMLPLIKKGGKIRFITPSKNAYGETGSSGRIGAFMSLDFEVEVKQ
jgi:hypothetical protein